MNPITMRLAADKYIRLALEEDINSEDVSANAVMPDYKKGQVFLIAKEDGIIAGLQVFERVFRLLDENTTVTCLAPGALSESGAAAGKWTVHVQGSAAGARCGIELNNGEKYPACGAAAAGKKAAAAGAQDDAKTTDGSEALCGFDRPVRDGDAVKKGQVLAVVTGDIRVLLSGERTALNYLQRMSGIATYTHQVAALLEGSGTRLLDTRKTTPCMRIFEKYAVTVGGGHNHRYNLSDGVLLKDNHINAAGGVKEAVWAAKNYAPFVRKIEVETENLDMVREAVEAGADIIMLDNMAQETMAEALRIIDGRAETECSGNVTKENIETITSLGVDYISSGALTHSAPILDISLKHLQAL